MTGIDATDPRIEACEFETFPFTIAERDAIARYTAAVAGTPDCFDVNTMAGIPEEFTIADTTNMFRSWFVMLADWRGHLVDLAADLNNDGRLSEAARRYLQHALTEWKTAQEEHRALVIEYLVGTDEHGSRFAEPAIVQGATIHASLHSCVFSFDLMG